MNKIVNFEHVSKTANELHKAKKRIVLAGGCFDILHIGHITFLTRARQKGDVLIVMLESDERIKKLKGPDRPINMQTDRANVLAGLSYVDYVIMLPNFTADSDYEDLVKTIKPAIIATTKGDSNRHHKERIAALINASVIDVTDQIANQSTTEIASLLYEKTL